MISVDDHVIEPADMFEGRIPKKFEELGPVVVELENGTQLWRIEDQLVPNIGLNATVGKEEGCTTEPQRFDEMRRGTWDIKERVRGYGHRRCLGLTLLPVGALGLRRLEVLVPKESGIRAGRHESVE